MKYWIFPSIMEFGGLGLGAFFCYLLVLQIQLDATDQKMVLILAALILGFVTYFGHFGTQVRLAHHKALMKKHGIWEDEEIKKPSKKDGK